jgi:hypothetical protein
VKKLWSGLWVNKFLSVPYFWKGYNNPQGCACWKWKKGKNQPTLLYSTAHIKQKCCFWSSTIIDHSRLWITWKEVTKLYNSCSRLFSSLCTTETSLPSFFVQMRDFWSCQKKYGELWLTLIKYSTVNLKRRCFSAHKCDVYI